MVRPEVGAMGLGSGNLESQSVLEKQKLVETLRHLVDKK